jgi:hypothetical protein
MDAQLFFRPGPLVQQSTILCQVVAAAVPRNQPPHTQGAPAIWLRRWIDEWVQIWVQQFSLVTTP